MLVAVRVLILAYARHVRHVRVILSTRGMRACAGCRSVRCAFIRACSRDLQSIWCSGCAGIWCFWLQVWFKVCVVLLISIVSHNDCHEEGDAMKAIKAVKNAMEKAAAALALPKAMKK